MGRGIESRVTLKEFHGIPKDSIVSTYYFLIKPIQTLKKTKHKSYLRPYLEIPYYLRPLSLLTFVFYL